MFLFRWVMKTFLNPCFNPSLTTCPTTSAPQHKPLSLCKISLAPCCAIQEELGGQVKTMHGESNRADWSMLCPTPVLCHQKNYSAGDLGPGVLHVELAWGTVSKQKEIPPLDTFLILPWWWGSSNSHHCSHASGGEHTIPRWIQVLEGSFEGGVKLESERLENLLHRACIWFWLFTFAGVTFEHHFELFLFLHVCWNLKKKYPAAALISLSLWSLFLTRNSCTEANGKDLPCKKENSNMAWN